MKLIEALEIIRTKTSDGAAGMRVELVCSFNPLHLQTFLSAWLRTSHQDRAIECNSGLYGDFLGNLPRLKQVRADAAVVAIEWGDLDPRLALRNLGVWEPDVYEDILKNARTRTIQLQSAIEAVSAKLPAIIVLPTLPLPPISHTPGSQAGTIELELRHCIAEFAIHAAQIPNVRIVNPERLDLLSPLGQRFDARSELATGFPYKLPHASTLAELISQLICPPVPKKGLITDLDDTLWNGILGETGIDGVSWDLEHHSHMHGLYQRSLRALASAGVLVGVASKNDNRVVEGALQRKDLILAAEHVFPVEANWGPKSESIRRILKTWNIGADAVVFIDDSPMELAEVKAVHPEIECIQFPKTDEQAVYELTARLRDIFGKARVSAEDRLRASSIRQAQVMAAENLGHGKAPAEFLKQAKAELSFSFVKHPLDPRALELINKTNQFNLNGQRYSEVSWQSLVNSPDSFLLIAAYQDKYGPLGKIAVIAGRVETGKVYVDSWVMSCRAFGRCIEHRCLQELFERFDAEEVVLNYEPTHKNGPVRDFLTEVLETDPVPLCSVRKEQFRKHRVEHWERVTEVSSE